MEKVQFDYSKSEVVAFLITKGYVPCDVFVKENKRYNNSKKVYFRFEGERSELIKVEHEFKSSTDICLNEYIQNLYNVKKIISEKLK